MKKVITMVGTSIFENFFNKNNDNSAKGYFNDLKNKRVEKIEDEKSKVNYFKKVLEKWISEDKDKKNISAEIKSLIKLKEELKDDFKIYFLCSDTILSKLAGEIIENVISQIMDNIIELNIKTIAGLQIWDRDEFNKGMGNLIAEIYDISEENWDNVIINITGGYKATIPYLTILAQINNCPIYYIFEDTDALIKIPNIPLSKEWFDWKKLKEYKNFLEKLEQGITEKSEYYALINSEFYRDYSFLIWTDEEGLASLNPIGEIIYNKYKEKVFEFYTYAEIFSIIQNNKDLKELFVKQFSNKEKRKNKTEEKNGHFVYDAGNNQLRIFYREFENNVYVYKVFANHDEYERYLNSTPFNENILNYSKFKRYEIEKEV